MRGKLNLSPDIDHVTKAHGGILQEFISFKKFNR